MSVTTVNTAMAQLLERQFRNSAWSQGLLMATGAVPCEPWSCPTADGTINLELAQGLISVNSYDLACVQESETLVDSNGNPVRIVYINLPTGCRELNRIVYLHNTCTDQSEDQDPLSVVRVVLQNQGTMVQQGQAESIGSYYYFIVAPGDLRYVMISGDGVNDSVIVTITN